MKLIFVDETSDSKFKDYFGLCCTVIDGSYYRILKTEFQKLTLNYGWDPNIELKGEYLFSASSGCQAVSVDNRVDLAEKLLELSTAGKNRRIKFYYFRKSSSNQKEDYLNYLPKLLDKALGKAEQKNGKDVLALHCDFRNDITEVEIRNAIQPVLDKKGFTLFEDIALTPSNPNTIGILYADITAYLLARIDTISNDIELFKNISPEQLENNGKVKKLKSSVKLIQHIKKLETYHIKTK